MAVAPKDRSEARISKDNDNRASAARTAVASPNSLWVEGLPLLKSSSSMQGKSSCTNEKQ